ncbi:MAG: hypothetical protein RL264_2451 [Bacteroidota bacterium]|jgi:RND family efflux transporter MFP subunit
MKSNAILLGAALFSIAVATSCSAPKEEEKEKEVVFVPLVKFEPAQIKTFRHIIVAQGNVETDQDVMVTAETGGMITKMMVKEGDRVAAGQTIATLDVAIINSSAQELETQLDYAEYMFKKQEELKNRGVGSEFDYETAKNQVKALRAKLNSLNTQKSKSVIKAPFSGVIDAVLAKQGQMAGPQVPIVRLVNNSNLDIVAQISEKHLNFVKLGTSLEAHFPNFEKAPLTLKVTNVGSVIEPTNRTFRIMAKVSGNKDLLPNMLVEVRITDQEVANALVIPSKSILKGQDNTDYVWTAQAADKGEFIVKKAKITLIEKQDGEAMIVPNEMIKEGSKIIVDGARGITENDRVRVK